MEMKHVLRARYRSAIWDPVSLQAGVELCTPSVAIFAEASLLDRLTSCADLCLYFFEYGVSFWSLIIVVSSSWRSATGSVMVKLAGHLQCLLHLDVIGFPLGASFFFISNVGVWFMHFVCIVVS